MRKVDFVNLGRMKPQDLPTKLLDAAEAIVDEHGTAALTMRALATRASVSRQAPYLHFASKEALLAALAAMGLRRERSWATAALTDDAKTELLAMGRAHLRLRAKHPGLYALAHGAVPKSASTQLQAEAEASFALLRDAVRRLSPENTPIGVVRSRCMVVWALVSGLGALDQMASTPTSVPGDASDWLREGLDALCRGWKLTARRL